MDDKADMSGATPVDHNRGDAFNTMTDKFPVAHARDAIRARRRQVLLGGFATVGFTTLANRSALAGTAGVCTISAVGSANPSVTIAGSCGDSPGCWKNHDFDVWADNATFDVGGVTMPVPYTHSTVITTVFPILASSPFVLGTGSAAPTLQNMINGAASIDVALTDESTMTIFDTGLESPGEQLNTAAAILNQYFYGSRYYAGSIETYIGGVLASVKSVATNASLSVTTAKSQIATLMSNMTNTLDTLNNQGETCAL